ncbi:MAG: MFS transporter [Usitatibacter sp.]
MPFIADALTYVVSVVSLMKIKAPFHIERAPSKRNLREEVAEGLRWLWSNRLIRYMAFLTGAQNLINAAAPLMIIMLAKEMGADDGAIGVIFGISGVGGILGSLVGGRIQRRFTFGQVIIATIWASTLLFTLYAVAPSYLLLGVVSGAIYFLMPIYNVVQFSYRLSIIPDRLQGRVNSVFRMLAFGFMPIGAALSGVLIERFGAIVAVEIFSAWLVLWAIATTINPHIRKAAPISREPPTGA